MTRALLWNELRLAPNAGLNSTRREPTESCLQGPGRPAPNSVLSRIQPKATDATVTQHIEPSFGDWVTESVLLPTAATGGWPGGLNLVRGFPTLVPNYQRGIAWGAAEVNDLVYSSSPVIGTAVLGKFTAPPAPYVGASAIGLGDNFEELADGLQRFSTGTALLKALDDAVLQQGAAHSQHAALFQQTSAKYAGSMSLVRHNDEQLRKHTRHAISEQYDGFAKAVTSWLVEQLAPTKVADFATKLQQLLLVRPVAVDRWDGFNSGLELMYTFVGLNTARVELGPSTYFARTSYSRRHQRAGHNRHRSVRERLHGRFHGQREERQRSPSLRQRCLEARLRCERRTHDGVQHVGALNKVNDVDSFLELCLAFKNASGSYIDQIRAIGAIPFGIAMACHLRRFRSTGKLPDFLSTGTPSATEEAELHALLCGSLRSHFAKKLGYQSDLIGQCLRGTTATLSDAATALSTDAVNAGLDTQVQAGWLVFALDGVDKQGAKLVFNAMLLPSRAAGTPPLGGAFVPVEFGRAAANWAIDHLHPEGTLSNIMLGYAEGKRLRNLAPLPGAQNSSAKHAPPSVKLQSAVQTYYTHAASTHPYCAWLATDAASALAVDLDSQIELQPNSTSGLGDARINHIAGDLIGKI